MSLDWTPEEVSSAVAVYLRMLTLELTEQVTTNPSIAAHGISLRPGRSENAIEFKHGNISAVMLELGYPLIHG